MNENLNEVKIHSQTSFICASRMRVSEKERHAFGGGHMKMFLRDIWRVWELVPDGSLEYFRDVLPWPRKPDVNSSSSKYATSCIRLGFSVQRIFRRKPFPIVYCVTKCMRKRHDFGSICLMRLKWLICSVLSLCTQHTHTQAHRHIIRLNWIE